MEEREEWMRKMKEQSKSGLEGFTIEEEHKQQMWDALATGQRIAIDIHYQDQMTSVVFDRTLVITCRNSRVLSVSWVFAIEQIKTQKLTFHSMSVVL